MTRDVNAIILQDVSEEAGKRVPAIIEDSQLVQLYYKRETSFGSPKGVVYLSFHSPASYSSPENAVLTSLFVRLLLDQLNELSYDAELAGLSYNVFGTTTGFLISFSG